MKQILKDFKKSENRVPVQKSYGTFCYSLIEFFTSNSAYKISMIVSCVTKNTWSSPLTYICYYRLCCNLNKLMRLYDRILNQITSFQAGCGLKYWQIPWIMSHKAFKLMTWPHDLNKYCNIQWYLFFEFFRFYIRELQTASLGKISDFLNIDIKIWPFLF